MFFYGERKMSSVLCSQTGSANRFVAFWFSTEHIQVLPVVFAFCKFIQCCWLLAASLPLHQGQDVFVLREAFLFVCCFMLGSAFWTIKFIVSDEPTDAHVTHSVCAREKPRDMVRDHYRRPILGGLFSLVNHFSCYQLRIGDTTNTVGKINLCLFPFCEL